MRKPLLVLVLMVVAALLGCSRQATPPDQTAADRQSVAQEADKLLTANQPSDDQMNTTIEQTALADPSLSVHDSMLSVYSITMLWGQFPPSVTDTTPVYDWSGSTYVNGVGRYVVVCPIDFEHGSDSVIRTNVPTSIAWQSTTDSDIDGLATLLLLRRDAVYVMEPHFVFKTGMASLDVPISRLDKFDTLIMVNNRQSLVIKAWRIIRPTCPTMTMSGDWIRLNNTGDSGTFHGVMGDSISPVAGRFWTDPDGSRHLEGWWSAGMLTVIAGEMKGTWSFVDPSMCPICGVGMGEFHGTFKEVLGNNPLSGKFYGVFGIGPGPGQQVMPFRGVLKADCVNTHTSVK